MSIHHLGSVTRTFIVWRYQRAYSIADAPNGIKTVPAETLQSLASDAWRNVERRKAFSSASVSPLERNSVGRKSAKESGIRVDSRCVPAFCLRLGGLAVLRRESREASVGVVVAVARCSREFYKDARTLPPEFPSSDIVPTKAGVQNGAIRENEVHLYVDGARNLHVFNFSLPKQL